MRVALAPTTLNYSQVTSFLLKNMKEIVGIEIEEGKGKDNPVALQYFKYQYYILRILYWGLVEALQHICCMHGLMQEYKTNVI